MKKLFIETNAENMVAFSDGTNAYVVEAYRFDENLTLDVAKTADYSNFDGCKTAEECNIAMGENSENVYSLADIIDGAERVTEF